MYDVTVIGGGPGGYVAAIRAAQLGAKVLLLEKDKIGGVCLNRGCIPTKTLLKSAEKLLTIKQAATYGLNINEVSLDWAAVMGRKNEVVTQLRTGVERIVKSYGIEVRTGSGAIKGPGRVVVSDGGRTETVETGNIIIATGAVPKELPALGAGLSGLLTSDEALELTEIPGRLAVIGAGAVGLEFASIYAAFGSEVTVIELQPTILPSLDADLAKRVAMVMRKQGIRIITGAETIKADQAGTEIRLQVGHGGRTDEVAADRLLIAGGRRPVVENLGLAAAGVEFDAAGIRVNERMATNIPGIYAVGDVTGRDMLAHVASREGIVAVENAVGSGAVMDYRAVPSCVFTIPEVASVGLSETAARELNIPVRTGSFNLAGNGMAVASAATDGLVKTVAAAGTGKVLGLHIFGSQASSMIMEGVLAVQKGLTVPEITTAIHPHPTLTEAILESALATEGLSIHNVKPRPGGGR